ncbi:MAG TPA: NrfD/PsrC family molybdoenzyme membrane anchor subunit [Solirubrobacteraceae bacterium]|nr:NrfD/PsrC family molybdoenzyme membrane anchor subunit [Solirubrobacteraceae bacterium]
MSERPHLGTTRLAQDPRRPRAERSPYGRPVIKQPVWTWEIPLYLYSGGLAGAAAGLAYLADRSGNDVLARRAWPVAAGATAVSPLLLSKDLGKPSRFLNMLRMVKVTSPMSIGSWILTLSGPASATAAADALTGRLALPGRAARPAAALLGLPLATYTAALVANTAVPVWHEARRLLPFLFAASAAASAGAALTALTPAEAAQPARRLAVAGAAASLGLVQAMERTLGDLAHPYHEGAAGRLTRAAKVLTGAGAAVIAAGARRNRAAAIAGGALVTAGAMCERWAIFRAGFQSAASADDTVAPQRERIEAGRTPGAARTEPRVSPSPRGSPATALDG